MLLARRGHVALGHGERRVLVRRSVDAGTQEDGAQARHDGCLLVLEAAVAILASLGQREQEDFFGGPVGQARVARVNFGPGAHHGADEPVVVITQAQVDAQQDAHDDRTDHQQQVVADVQPAIGADEPLHVAEHGDDHHDAQGGWAKVLEAQP